MEYYILELTGQRIMLDIRLTLFKRMQSQSLRFFDRHPVGRLVTRVTNDIENLNEMFKSVFITVFKRPVYPYRNLDNPSIPQLGAGPYMLHPSPGYILCYVLFSAQWRERPSDSSGPPLPR